MQERRQNSDRRNNRRSIQAHGQNPSTRVSRVAEKVRDFWHKWIPAWIPICITIFGGFYYAGQHEQRIEDDLITVKKEVKEMQDYLRKRDDAPLFNKVNPAPNNGDSRILPEEVLGYLRRVEQNAISTEGGRSWEKMQ